MKKILLLLLILIPSFSHAQSSWSPRFLPITLSQGGFFVGNSSGIASAVTMSGDATITSSGVVTVLGSSGATSFAGNIVQTSGNIKAPLSKTGAYNLSLVRATTTNANDSIKIQCGTAACSASNPGFVVIGDSTTAGVTQQFKITANVTILLTGATWGIGGTGDITGGLLRALFINDFGTLRTCVGYMGGRNTVLTTDTNATQANVNLPEEILCNTAVSSASNTVLDWGYFRANFDDTGGAAEDLWAIQTGVNDIVSGQTADGLWQPWNTVATGFTTSLTVAVSRWSQVGRTIFIDFQSSASTSNSTGFTVTAPVKSRRDAYMPLAYAYNNSANIATGQVQAATGSTTLTLETSLRTGWTAALNKAANFLVSYEVGPAASFIE